MYKKSGVILIILSIFLLMLGLCYLIFCNVLPAYFYRQPDITGVRTYLEEKYHRQYNSSDISFVTSYCLAESNSGLVYSSPCNSEKIINFIYLVHDNNLKFYVKEVRYPESKINLTEEDKNTESEGFYDTYLSTLMSFKLEDILLQQYQDLFSSTVFVDIYDGLGIDNPSITNLYQSLGKDFQSISDSDISIDSFITYLPATARDLHIHIKIDEDITSVNFQSMVSKLVQLIENSTVNSQLTISQVLLEFDNQNRYLEFSTGIIRLKTGKNIYSANSKVYPMDIVYGNQSSTTGISYQEFMSLPKKSFSF